jgi:hypothetical protein
MLVQIDENSATLAPFGSLTRIFPSTRQLSKVKSWGELLRSCFLRREQKRADEIPAARQNSAPHLEDAIRTFTVGSFATKEYLDRRVRTI